MAYGYPQDDHYGGFGGPGPPPDNQLVPAILTTIFCCVPFGIVSIVFAAQVNSKWQLGDLYGAQHSADMARKWWIAALITGLAVGAVYILFVVLAGGLSLLGSSSGLD